MTNFGPLAAKLTLLQLRELQTFNRGRPGITPDEYDRRAREPKEEQAELTRRIEQHQDGEGSFRETLESLISAASRVAEIFERSNIEQKRQLVAFVFSNLHLRGKKLEFSLRSPFDLMVDRPDYASWLGDLDSNQD